MTNEQQRIAIAEACGWSRPCDLVTGTELARKWFPPGLSITTDSNDLRHLPNYLTDLNAMHEAEKLITDNTGYIMALKAVTGEYLSPFALVTATAAQRAEAFLKHMNLWTE